VQERGPFTLTVLGCAGTYAGPGEACSGYLLRTATTSVMVDLGSGALANLQRHTRLADLDAVVLTHEHPDHWLDLFLLRNALKYVLGLEGLPVHGTAGIERLARTMVSDLGPTLAWHTVDERSTVAVGDVRLTFGRTDHPVETLAVRAEAAGRTLLYSADTGARWRPGALGDGVDTLLCEASFPPDHEDRFEHLTARQAGAYAAGMRAERLLLTHIQPEVDRHEQRARAAAVFGGDVGAVAAGDVLAV
jgi:ribonuclease BN (tRNA processing enzyme)